MPTTPPTSTLADDARGALAALDAANGAHARRYPGDRGERQPVHVVYGGAHLFRRGIARRLGELALASLDAHAPDAFALAAALELPGHARLPGEKRARTALAARFAREPDALRAAAPEHWLPLAVHARVLDKLRAEPVEDYRIDFEDGFGVRPEAEEDETAVRAARELAAAVREGLAPPMTGVRIKALSEESARRAVRTLDLFVSTLVADLGRLPERFVVTLPKVAHEAQPRTLARLAEVLEHRLGLAEGALRIELMIERPEAIVDHEGRSPLLRWALACEGRCVAAHFGTYDYTASSDVVAAHQRMDHPASLFALQAMKTAFAGTGIALSDGATNVLPVGVHRPAAGRALSTRAARENAASVRAGWRLMARNVRASLERGIYQGWDLHPAQLPVRHATTFAFFLEGLDDTAARLRQFVERAAHATLARAVFDDAATGQGLLNFFLRGTACGALTADDLARTGLSVAELRSRSFTSIVAGRAMPGATTGRDEASAPATHGPTREMRAGSPPRRGTR